MRIHFHGAAGTTTGSMHLIEINGKRILLECGLLQGKRKEAFERNRNLPFDASAIDVCVLSHAHIDHSGNLPSLVKHGYRGPILATPATIDLCEIMLLDSAHIQAKDVEYVNKKRARQGKRPFEPLYTEADVHQTLKQFSPLPYGASRLIAPEVTLTFHNAGHILGSAIVVLDASEHGKNTRILFTGDMGRSKMPILKDPVVIRHVDCLITESTYGSRLHPPPADVKDTLAELCAKIVERRSRLVIPAFSVGRTQQLLYFLHMLWCEDRIPRLPVFVDSPLSTRATRVYDRHPECFDRELRKLLANSEDPFAPGSVRYVRDATESKGLNKLDGPILIISASGMCEAGRILHHLKHSVEDPNDIILIVGWQAEHTLGRRLIERVSPIRIFGEEYELRAEVQSVQALSAHADRNELMQYFVAMGPEVQEAFVVHGEPEASSALVEVLRQLRAKRVRAPARDDVVEI